MTALLKLKEVHAYYGGIHALKGICMDIEEGKIVTLIGSNGAGKTTLLKTISGIMKPSQGSVLFGQENITGIAPHAVAQRKIAHVPEGRQVFSRMTIKENLELGAFTVRNKLQIKEDTTKVLDLFPRLKERLFQKAGTLSGGEQQMLAIARAMMMRPKILLLDEPSMGLAPIIVEQIFDIIVNLNVQGMTILLVEQNANQALKIAHRGYVIQTGEITKSDDAINLLNDSSLKEAYLGV